MDNVKALVVTNGNTNKEFIMRFTLEELLQAGNHKWDIKDVDVIIKRNLEDLCRKINKLGFQPARYASSCLRSLKDQQRINPSAMGSSHLYGCAVDVADPDGGLTRWVQTSVGRAKLVECGLWVEDPKYTNGWLHLSSYMPKSGNRIFIP